jgi:hypothetical protein
MNRPPISVGVEIEVNAINQSLRSSVDWDLWEQAGEHCGVELRTSPCRGIGGLKKLKKSLEKMGKSKGAKACGFNNAGTHLHIDFLTENAPKDDSLVLKRKAAPTDHFGDYYNPFGNGKKWYWVTSDGRKWESPAAYRMSASRRGTSARVAYNKTPDNILNGVKRFFILGIRFADVLFAIQHPDRRFNKYCHTIEGWDEKLVKKAKSVGEIATHPNLQQNHRRHMFNAMAFRKWGTIEIRMLKASLDADEIWAQMMLFTRLARLARTKKVKLPKATGMITKDFTTLINFAGMHGKYRKVLVDVFGRNIRVKQFRCFCFRCYREYRQTEFYDYGLSRAVCRGCHTNAACVMCSRALRRDVISNKHRIDDLVEGGRWLCKYCFSDENIKSVRTSAKKKRGSVSILGATIGSGYDEQGMRQLRRMRELFT